MSSVRGTQLGNEKELFEASGSLSQLTIVARVIAASTDTVSQQNDLRNLTVRVNDRAYVFAVQRGRYSIRMSAVDDLK